MRGADGRPRAGRGAPGRRPACPEAADRTVPGGRLRPLFPDDGAPPGRRGRRPGNVRPRPPRRSPGFDATDPSAPGCSGSPPTVVARRWRSGAGGRSWPRRPRSASTTGPASPIPTTWPANSNGPPAGSDPSTAGIHPLPRTESTLRGNRRGHRTARRDRQDLAAPGPRRARRISRPPGGHC